MIGNILISILAGVAAFAALTVLGVPFAVPLAFVVAVTDLIPMIGATLGAVICVLVALLATRVWPTTVLVAAFFVLYQQLENYLIAPRITHGVIKLSPTAVLAGRPDRRGRPRADRSPDSDPDRRGGLGAAVRAHSGPRRGRHRGRSARR